MPLYLDEKKLTSELCSKCGACCKHYPGAYAPEDFGDTPSEIRRRVREVFRGGRITIDWFEGDPREDKIRKRGQHMPPHLKAYKLGEFVRGTFVRPAMKGMEGFKTDPAWGGKPCTFLGVSGGCELPFKSRPENCRRLVPVQEGGKPACGLFGAIEANPKQLYSLRWLPYRLTLFDLAGW